MLDRRSLLKAALGMLGLPLVKMLPPAKSPPARLVGAGPRQLSVPTGWTAHFDPGVKITNLSGYYTDVRCRVAGLQPFPGGYFIEEPQ